MSSSQRRTGGRTVLRKTKNVLVADEVVEDQRRVREEETQKKCINEVRWMGKGEKKEEKAMTGLGATSGRPRSLG